MTNGKQTMGGVAVVAGALLGMGGLAGGCDGGAGSAAGVALTSGQLALAIEGGARIEVTLGDDGSVREVEIEDEGLGHADQIQGRVVSFDGGVIALEHLGAIDIAGANRFRDDAESHQDKGVWVTELSAVLTGGGAVYVRADGSFAVERFDAADVRLERGLRRPRIEGDVSPADFDATAGTLRLGGRTFSIAGASIHTEDGVEAGDDNGNDGVEVGDDNGNDGVEAGDDNGNDGVEVGDDNGDDGVEVGDDNGDDGVEVGDDHGGHGGDEAGDDHGGHGSDD